MEERFYLTAVETPIGIDRHNEQLREFVASAMTLVESHLEHNHQEAHGLTDVDKSVDEVLSRENIKEVQVRARQLENPRVTVWLKDCPIWANDAWTETFHPWDINDYNGKVTATLDVRPF
jgi:hypothetical protein